jgi:chemotaxis response regulator CheB
MPNTGDRADAQTVKAKIVLVADDNPLIRKMLCRMFEAEEHYNLCEQAENGRQAIELALRCRPDLIILDLSMPVMNGLEAAWELKRLMPHVPIILFSQHAVALDKKSPSGLLFDRFVSKVESGQLMKHVKELAPMPMILP